MERKEYTVVGILTHYFIRPNWEEHREKSGIEKKIIELSPYFSILPLVYNKNIIVI